MKIIIGADELILWMRKNDIAKGIPNDEVNGLGFRICRIIETLGGKKITDNKPAIWPTPDNSKEIDKFMLPKTSSQYEIELKEIPAIYTELSKL